MALGMYDDHQIKVFITFTSSLCPVYQPTALWNTSMTHLPMTCTPNMKAVCSSKSLDDDDDDDDVKKKHHNIVTITKTYNPIFTLFTVFTYIHSIDHDLVNFD